VAQKFQTNNLRTGQNGWSLAYAIDEKVMLSIAQMGEHIAADDTEMVALTDALEKQARALSATARAIYAIARVRQENSEREGN
jgi:hypothetical protein